MTSHTQMPELENLKWSSSGSPRWLSFKSNSSLPSNCRSKSLTSRRTTKHRLIRTSSRRTTLSFSSQSWTKSWRITNAIRRIGTLMQTAYTSWSQEKRWSSMLTTSLCSRWSPLASSQSLGRASSFSRLAILTMVISIQPKQTKKMLLLTRNRTKSRQYHLTKKIH